jgi:succinate dehydrogenase / fumarate reductase membrane anchor subunit
VSAPASSHAKRAGAPYRAQQRPTESKFELYAWLFMRVSGILLIFMALFHLWQMHIQVPIDDVDWQFVAQRFTTPFWRIYDLVMLWLAVLHGINGLRIVIDDYLSGGLRVTALSVAFLIGFLMLLVGSYTLVVFPASPELMEQAAAGAARLMGSLPPLI